MLTLNYLWLLNLPQIKLISEVVLSKILRIMRINKKMIGTYCELKPVGFDLVYTCRAMTIGLFCFVELDYICLVGLVGGVGLAWF